MSSQLIISVGIPTFPSAALPDLALPRLDTVYDNILQQNDVDRKKLNIF